MLSAFSASRVHVAATLQLRPTLSRSSTLLPFEILLNLRVYLPMSSLSTANPCPVELLDCQRLLFTTLLPPLADPAPYARHGRQTTLPFFYESLLSAAPFEEGEADEAVQSLLLEPTLLGFQRRSVRFLLGREGAKVTAYSIIEKEPDETYKDRGLEVWWEKVHLPLIEAPPIGRVIETGWNLVDKRATVVWWNRLTGGLVGEESEINRDPYDIDLRRIKGGMLCEEMGASIWSSSLRSTIEPH